MTVMTHTAARPRRSSGAATIRPTRTLTGVQPTGDLHLGNYVGAVRPLADLAADPGREVYVFVADLHALNSRPEPAALRERSRRLAAALLACGLDRPNVHVYRQSRVPAVAGMAALLNNVAGKGLLNRAHAYKAAVAANVAAGRDRDHGVNMGLYSYPVLMAADILALDADEVPVGADQAQHLEIAVDLAQQFARSYESAVLRAPRGLIPEATATLPGLDGRKMSKSYGNTIPLMAEPDHMRRQIRRIVTDSTPPEQPKDPDACTLVALRRAFADPRPVAAVEDRYRTGGIG
jgi:tryptophanyl-tRNA synthetase